MKRGGPPASAVTAPRLSAWKRSGDLAVLAMVPPLLFLLVLFVYPVAKLLLLSVEHGSFEHYHRALFDGLYVQVFVRTFRIAALVTLFSILLGYPIAHFLANARQPWLIIGLICVMLPFWTSLLVRTYAWMVILGRNGVINHSLLGAGIISEPLDLLHNETGVLIGMVHVLMPYLVFPLYAVMRRVDRELLTAAEGLGAPGWQVFLKVYLPLTLPGLIAGAALVFIISIGFFITPALLGGGRVMMIAVLIEEQIRQFLNWGFAAALCAVLLVSTLVVSAAINRSTREQA